MLGIEQNFLNLYPTVDKDNHNNDPVQAVSAASNELLGQVNVNDPIKYNKRNSNQLSSRQSCWFCCY